LVLELTEMLGKTRCGLNCYKTLPTPGLVSGVTNMHKRKPITLENKYNLDPYYWKTIRKAWITL
jgi:hypothetical protein